jgi:hypothetical protein
MPTRIDLASEAASLPPSLEEMRRLLAEGRVVILPPPPAEPGTLLPPPSIGRNPCREIPLGPWEPGRVGAVEALRSEGVTVYHPDPPVTTSGQDFSVVHRLISQLQKEGMIYRSSSTGNLPKAPPPPPPPTRFDRDEPI